MKEYLLNHPELVSLIVLIVELAMLVMFIRWVYYKFVLPASAEKYDWYKEYLQLVDLVSKVDSRHALDESINAFYNFTRDKNNLKNPIYKYFTRQVVKMLVRKHKLYRTKPLTA